MLREFKKFVMRGNVIDLAVGIIIGAAFSTIITSLVGDIIMPPIGLILGKVDFNNMFFTLAGTHFNTLAEAKAGGAVTINYGIFINHIVNFLILAFIIFLMVRWVNKLKGPEELPPPAMPTKEEILLTEIRDILKAQKG